MARLCQKVAWPGCPRELPRILAIRDNFVPAELGGPGTASRYHVTLKTPATSRRLSFSSS